MPLIFAEIFLLYSACVFFARRSSLSLFVRISRFYIFLLLIYLVFFCEKRGLLDRFLFPTSSSRSSSFFVMAFRFYLGFLRSGAW